MEFGFWLSKIWKILSARYAFFWLPLRSFLFCWAETYNHCYTVIVLWSFLINLKDLYWFFLLVSNLGRDGLEVKYQASRQYKVSEYTKQLIKTSLSFSSRYITLNSTYRINCFLAFLQMVETGFSKSNFRPILIIPKTTTEFNYFVFHN